MKTIPLTQGKFALVDDEDYVRLSCYKWSVSCCKGRCYAIRSIGTSDGKRVSLFMHRLILDVPVGMQTDHINGDGLDNRRRNLRVCNNAENHWNQRLTDRNSSGYKGVTFQKDHRSKPWRVRIRIGTRQNIHLGYYHTPEAAAQAYDMGALKYHGEFARTNKMLGLL